MKKYGFLHKDGVNSSLSDSRSHELHELGLSQMHMHVRRGRQLEPLRGL